MAIVDQPKCTKKIYDILNEDDSALIASAKSWRNILQEDFDLEMHFRAFKEINVTTNVVKLRSFQYRLLHNKFFVTTSFTTGR